MWHIQRWSEDKGIQSPSVVPGLNKAENLYLEFHIQLCGSRCPFRAWKQWPEMHLICVIRKARIPEYINLYNAKTMYNIKIIFSRISVGSKALPWKLGVVVSLLLFLSCNLNVFIHCMLLPAFSGYCTLAIVWWGLTVWPVRVGSCTPPRFVCWILLQELWGPWTSPSTWPSGWYIKNNVYVKCHEKNKIRHSAHM